jgi:hypothetical protein
MDCFDFEGQKRRRAMIVSGTLARCGHILRDEKGFSEWARESGARDALFLSAGLLAVENPDIELVGRLFEAHPAEEWEHFCAFTPFMSIVQLLRHGEILPQKLRDRLARRAVCTIDRVLLPPLDFVGVNDNHPAMGMGLLFLAGEHFGRPEWTAAALRRLGQLEQMLADRTFISEFNSPTYHAVTVFALAALAGCAKDPGVRGRALGCERALWKMALALYHRPSSQAAGPYARAYIGDSSAALTQYRMLFYQVLGDSMALNPLNTLYAFSGLGKGRGNGLAEELAFHGSAWFAMFSNCWLASADYHCPRELIDEALNRPYPVWLTGTAQMSASAETHMLPAGGEAEMLAADLSPLYEQDDLLEYAAGVTNVYSYLTEQYALGTCTKPFHNGAQCDSFHAIISEGAPPAARRQKELSAIYARCVVNGQCDNPGLVYDYGRKMAFQWENTGMALYSPKTDAQDIRSLKLCILISNGFRAVKEIRCGAETLAEGWEGEGGAKEPVFVRFGKAYCAFWPLTAGAPARLRVERVQNALSLSLVHYEGPEVRFSRKGLKLAVSGFVCAIRAEGEAGSFAQFIGQMSGASISDTLCANLHTRFAVEREVSYSCGPVSLACCYSPVSEGIRYIRANGRILV